MTRSRKKTPCCHVAGHDGSWKAIYSRRLRRIPNVDYENGVSTIPDGMYYRRLNCPWNISDLKCTHMTYDSWLGYDDDDPEGRNWYERAYIRK